MFLLHFSVCLITLEWLKYELGGFILCFPCCLLLSVLDTVLWTKVHFFELMAGSQAFNNTGSLLALLLVFPSHAHIIYLDSEYLNICVQSVKCGNYFLKQSLLFLNTSLELKEISTCLQDLPVIRKPHLPKVHVK